MKTTFNLLILCKTEYFLKPFMYFNLQHRAQMNYKTSFSLMKLNHLLLRNLMLYTVQKLVHRKQRWIMFMEKPPLTKSVLFLSLIFWSIYKNFFALGRISFVSLRITHFNLKLTQDLSQKLFEDILKYFHEIILGWIRKKASLR